MRNSLSLLLTVGALALGPFTGFGQNTNPMTKSTNDPDALVERARTAALAMQRKSWEQGVLAQAFLEAGHLINAFANIIPFCEHVLINVRHRQGVQVESGVPGIYP